MNKSKKKQNTNIQKMFEIMNNHYGSLKDTIQLYDAFQEPLPDEYTNTAFKKLRPLSPYLFSELLNEEFDPKKIENSKYQGTFLVKNDRVATNHEIVKSILYGNPTEKVEKKSLNRRQYAQLSENMRLMHNYVGQNKNILSERNIKTIKHVEKDKEAVNFFGTVNDPLKRKKNFFKYVKGNDYEDSDTEQDTNDYNSTQKLTMQRSLATTTSSKDVMWKALRANESPTKKPRPQSSLGGRVKFLKFLSENRNNYLGQLVNYTEGGYPIADGANRSAMLKNGD